MSVYLIAAVDEGLCKIGFGQCAQTRIESIQTACPFDLEVIAVREGGLALERAIHAAAGEHRIKREWFRYSPDIIEVFHSAEVPQSVIGSRPHSQIVKDAGAPETVAAARSVSVHTVRSWMQRDSIPAEHWDGFARARWATLQELAAAAAKRTAA